MTVGELRHAIEGLHDDMPVFCTAEDGDGSTQGYVLSATVATNTEKRTIWRGSQHLYLHAEADDDNVIKPWHPPK